MPRTSTTDAPPTTALRRRRAGGAATWMLGTALAVSLVAACSSADSEGAVPSEGLVERGAEVYATECASCHGEDLQGTDSGPSHLSVVYEPGHHPDAAFRSAIRNGSPQHHWEFGPMPPVPGLSDDEIEAVIVFVRSEQERQGFTSP